MLKTVVTVGGSGTNGTVTSVGTGTGLTGGPITTTGNISLANTAVTAGSYGTANSVSQVTIDAQGRITSASNVTIAIANSAVSGLGTMSTQNANNVTITGGTENNLTYTNVTINSGNIVVTYANIATAMRTQGLTGYLYGNANTGNVTASATIPNSAVSNLGTMSTQNANAVAITGGNVVANVTVTNTTAASATFGTSSLPLTPAGYIQIQLANATVVKVPYYAS